MTRDLRAALSDTRGSRRARRLAIGAAVTLLSLALNVWVAVHAQYQGRLDRDAARTPVASQASVAGAPDAGPTIALWHLTRERLGWDHVDVVSVAALDPTAPPPPGLTSWPEPGAVVPSRALTESAEGARFTALLGTPAGLIGDDGLADPGERIAYVGARPDRLTGALEIAGFGVDGLDVWRDRDLPIWPTYFTLVDTTQTMRAWWIGGALFLVAPSTILLVVAARLDGERRDRRLSVLRALGASPSQVRAAVLGEPLTAALGGAVTALALSALACTGTWPLPLVGQQVVGDDLRSYAAWFLVGPAAALLTLVGILLLTHRTARTSPFGTRPAPEPRRAARWPLWVIAASIVAANYGYSFFFHSGDPGMAMLVVVAAGTAAALASTGLTAALLEHCGRWFLALSRTRARPALLVCGRELQASSRPVVRATAGVALLSLVVVHAWLLVAASGEREREALRAHESNGDSVLELTVRDPQRWLETIRSALPPEVALLQIEGEPGGPQTVHGTCADRRAVVGTCDTLPADAVLPVPAVRAWIVGEAATADLSRSDGGSTSTRQLLVSATGQLLDRHALRSLVRTRSEATATVFFPHEDWVVMARAARHQARWLTGAGAVGLGIACATTAVSLTSEGRRNARRLALLGAVGAPSRFYYATGAGLAAMPLAVASIGGVGIAVLQVMTAVVLDTAVALPWAAIGSVATVGVLAASGTGLAAGRAVHRASHHWRTGSET